MQQRNNQKIALIATSLIIGVLLTACETGGIKPDDKSIQKEDEKKTRTPESSQADITKLSLKQIHNLSEYRECKKILDHAEKTLSKRPLIPVEVKDNKGLAAGNDLDNYFHLSPSVERYPLDDAIRNFDCPKTLGEVKVVYTLEKGPGYSPHYHYIYTGNLKGINVSLPTNPGGEIEWLYKDKPPHIILHMDKIQVDSLSPSYTFSNEDMDLTINEIMFGNNQVSFKFRSKSDNKLTIRKFRLFVSGREIQVDFKNNIVKLEEGQVYIKNRAYGKGEMNNWVLNDLDKYVTLGVTVAYRSGWSYKKLKMDKLVKIKDLGVNKN